MTTTTKTAATAMVKTMRMRRRSLALVATVLAACLSVLLLHQGGLAEAFSVRLWQRDVALRSAPPAAAEPDVDVDEGLGRAAQQDGGVVPRLAPLCRGTRDKEPPQYTCANQVEWGKCNETWVAEGDFCAEACGRCSGRVPVQFGAIAPSADPGEGEDDALETRARGGRGIGGMPDVGSHECGGHVTYEWRIRTNRAKEASGLAASRLNEKILWTHVDGWTTKVLAFLSDTVATVGGGRGSEPSKFGLQGQPILELDLPDWVNQNPKSGRVDWEDISTAQCPDGSKRQCIWISDTGNNKFNRGYSQVIAVAEPRIEHMQVDQSRRINTEYFTPNEVDKRNQQGLCQPGMGGDRCNHHKCKHDDSNFEKLKFEEWERQERDAARGYEESLWVFSFKFPGEKEKDSEALAVAPDGSRFWLFEKNEEVRGANVYESDLLYETLARDRARNGGKLGRYVRTELFSVAFLEPPCIAAGTNCVTLEEGHLFSITGADVHPLGKAVTLQTYKGPFVYEFEEGKPFDVSGMQFISPRPVMPYSSGWGAEAIAYSREGERLWQMPEENRHDGCQKVLVMDCAQQKLPPPSTLPASGDLTLQIRSEAGDSDRNRTRPASPEIVASLDDDDEEEESEIVAEMIDVKEEVEEIDEELQDIVQRIEDIASQAPDPEQPLTCDVIPNGWGTEKNFSIPICAGPDLVPPQGNSSERHSCEDQAAWGKCEDQWLIDGNFCLGACGRCTHTTCSCPDCRRLKKPQLLCNANQVLGEANASKVIIFDFDDTLKLHHPARQAPEALWAVREVIRLGYGIGIATASCHTDYVRKFLAEMDPEIFTPQLLFSNAFQSCQKKKTGALKCNLAHYGLLEQPECAVFFDDSISNEKYADEAGIRMIEVRKGVGVTKEKFRQGLDHMLQGCGKPPTLPGSPAAESVLRSNDAGRGCSRELEKRPPGGHTCKEQFRWGKCDELWMKEGHFCDFSCGRCGGQGGNQTALEEEAGEATLQQVYG